MKQPYYIGAVLAVLTVALFARSVSLSEPRQVVFDEVHFGKFTTAYCCTGERFFDIHPPHGKLAIAGVARLAGYTGGHGFTSIGEQYSDTVPVVAFRSLPVINGVLVVALVMLLIHQLGGTPLIVLLGGVATALDNALVVQSRLISLDMMLLAATLAAVSLFWAGRTGIERRGWWLWFLAAGGAAGFAVGVKFTGLTALGVLGMGTLLFLWRSRAASRLRWRWFVAGVCILLAAIVVYSAGWLLHWQLLSQPGSGDAFYTPDFSSGAMAYVTETVTYHRVMLSSNFNLTAEHPYASPWWQWPWMVRPIFYWQGSASFIYLLGNPVVWWGSSLLFLAAILVLTVQFGHRIRRSGNTTMWVPLLAYCIAMLPFVRIPRALFLYHYFMPLLFALIAGLLWVDGQLSVKARRVVVGTVGLAVVTAFLWFMPITYGTQLPEEQQSRLFWFTTWR